MKKILFVDDSYFQRVFIKEGFHDIPDIEPTTVDSQEDALLKLKENKYDWLLSDFEMAPMEPIEYFKKIKDLKGEFKVIIISGKLEEKNREELIQMGFNHILEKPFNFEDIMNIINKS